MSRSRFERELADLHGADVLEAEPVDARAYVVRPAYVRQAHQAGAFQAGARRRVDHVAFRIGAGLFGLFWVIVIGGALIVGLIVGAVMIYAAVTT